MQDAQENLYNMDPGIHFFFSFHEKQMELADSDNNSLLR